MCIMCLIKSGGACRSKKKVTEDLQCKLSDCRFGASIAFVFGATFAHKSSRHFFAQNTQRVRGMDVVQIFIGAGIDVNMRDRRGRTPLHKAIRNEEIVAALIESGADVNARVRLW